jgi:hypothetical protein
MEESKFDEAVGYFSLNRQHWEALVSGIQEARDGKFAEVRACMERPDTLDHQYWTRIGEMMGLDDVLYRLKATAAEREFSDLAPEPKD